MKQTQHINIAGQSDVISPEAIQAQIPLTEKAAEVVHESRQTVRNILSGEDKRMLGIVGPCSIHDPKSAFEYAERFKVLREEVSDNFYLIMRVYFEKPRTTVGWKGLINDPHLDGSCDINEGLKLGRSVMSNIANMGVPVATEVLDPFTPQYLSDLVSWAAIGARTTESQTHREMASGLSMPVGFKNGTNGNLQNAINAMLASREPHSFLGVSMTGKINVIQTSGNPHHHVILRGGDKPNFDPVSVSNAVEKLQVFDLPLLLMIDCSHGNSLKRFELQEKVFDSLITQRKQGGASIMGFMIESHLNEGNQKIGKNKDDLLYGVSITDSCLSFEATERILKEGNERLNGLKAKENG